MRRRVWLVIGIIIILLAVNVFLIVRFFITPAQEANLLPTLAPLEVVVEEQMTPMLPAVTSTPITTPSTVPTITYTPTETSSSSIYIVQDGDTLWEIAAQFGLSQEALIAANPALDPNLLVAGMEVVIPDSSQPLPTVVATQEQESVVGYVATGGERLLVRSSPEQADNILTFLESDAEVTIIGRDGSGDWLRAELPGGIEGWVMRRWINVLVVVEDLPVIGETDVAEASTPVPEQPAPTPILPVVTATVPPVITPGTSQQLPPPAVDYAYISNITQRSRYIYQMGQALGNRRDVFSKVGDSITDNEAFLLPIGVGDYDLDEHIYLQPVVNFYSTEIARTGNSFANVSLAAKGGWSVWHLFNTDYAGVVCKPGETPLECEYREVKPAVALIMIGTNDVLSMSIGTYETYMRRVIELSIERGVVPVVSTIPPMDLEEARGKVESMNGVIIDLTNEYQVPLWDYWGALQTLAGYGLSVDGIHPSWAVPAQFTPYFLNYGMTLRNLTALQALDAVWREALY